MCNRNVLSFSMTTAAVFLMAALCDAEPLADWRQRASAMVDSEIVAAGVTNERVIQAARDTPRHEFVPANQRQFAYLDMALPIGNAQTISPPFIVAYMTQEIDPQPTDRVLEIGTGSGYQSAVLAELAGEVYSIERHAELLAEAQKVLGAIGYKNIHTKLGDGMAGWIEQAPFDAILVTAAAEQVPPALAAQLKDGGRLILPLGRHQGAQRLVRLTRKGEVLEEEELCEVRFVPLLPGLPQNPR